MDPTQLDPEIKWRTMIGFFLNFTAHIHEDLKNELTEEELNRINVRVHNSFWGEQARALIELFALKPDNAINAHQMKRILAVLFDIDYEPIIETEDEVVDKQNRLSCPIYRTIKPIWADVCDFCGSWGRIAIAQLDTNFRHNVVFDEENCFHRTTRKGIKSSQE